MPPHRRWQPGAVISKARLPKRPEGYSPRVVVASATRLTASPYAAIRMLVFFDSRSLPRLVERLLHDVGQPRVDLLLLPEVLLEALYPLEVRASHDAPGVREHVGQDDDALAFEDVVGCRGVVGPFAPSDDPPWVFTLSAFSAVITCSSALGARMSHSRRISSSFVSDSAPLRPAERARLVLVRDRRRHVDGVGVVDAACRVREGDHLRAVLVAGSARESCRRCRSPAPTTRLAGELHAHPAAGF